MSTRIDELKEQVQQASWAYTMGNEIMTDAQYDALVAEMNLLRSGNDSIITAPDRGRFSARCGRDPPATDALPG